MTFWCKTEPVLEFIRMEKFTVIEIVLFMLVNLAQGVSWGKNGSCRSVACWRRLRGIVTDQTQNDFCLQAQGENEFTHSKCGEIALIWNGNSCQASGITEVLAIYAVRESSGTILVPKLRSKVVRDDGKIK